MGVWRARVPRREAAVGLCDGPLSRLGKESGAGVHAVCAGESLLGQPAVTPRAGKVRPVSAPSRPGKQNRPATGGETLRANRRTRWKPAEIALPQKSLR